MIFIVILYYYWLLVSVSNGPSSGQYIQKKLKNAGAYSIVHKYQFYGITFTLINGLYNYYQLLDVLFVVSCAEILYVSIL